MKPLPLKIDNYLLERIQEEARAGGTTKAEVVRSALIHYLLHKEDVEDAEKIRSRLHEPDIAETKIHARLMRQKVKGH
ncbi:MAG: ribbon-helix-helix protein, CopG family [Deltaproteobacteria bacterium]|nr:ribbon-helix-helix protein, CopG family [Deltaproteobacteria bacterium]MBI4374231.1 ribbon-helix-helix protein, CopG family [Deltaproteobacteria bacterium]